MWEKKKKLVWGKVHRWNVKCFYRRTSLIPFCRRGIWSRVGQFAHLHPIHACDLTEQKPRGGCVSTNPPYIGHTFMRLGSTFVTALSNSKHVGGCSPQRKCAIITPDARDHNTLPPGTAPTHMLAIARGGHIYRRTFERNTSKDSLLLLKIIHEYKWHVQQGRKGVTHPAYRCFCSVRLRMLGERSLVVT